jgi:serine-type D-Ala-D-Ala endopeptidase (penicillin-binding protein 7)
VGRVPGFLAPLMLSLTAWPSLAADVSSIPDTDAVKSNQAVLWQRALLPGAGLAWDIPSHHRSVRKLSSAATASGKQAHVRSKPRSPLDYLHPRECVVESDVAAGLDASTLALLAQIPARVGDEAPVTEVARAEPPPQPEPVAVADASPIVVPRPVAVAGPVVAAPPAPVVSASPAPVVTISPAPVVDSAAPVADVSPVVDANIAEPAGAVSVTKLDIKEPDQESAQRFVRLRLTSAAALVVDQQEGNLLFAKNPDAVRSIASITKLMTAMVALDAGLPLDERLTVQPADVRIAKGKESRLKVGVSLTRREMFKLALMSSENRAAAVLARTYPGGLPAFVEAMNRKADSLGMTDSRFVEPTGLDSNNVSTAHDLALMVNAAYAYPLIREATTSDLHEVPAPGRYRRRAVTYHNSNRLVRDSEWDVGLSKTGYIGKAGRCLVMQATIAAKPVIIVLLDSLGKVARVSDANRIKRWLERPDVTVAGTMRNKPRM